MRNRIVRAAAQTGASSPGGFRLTLLSMGAYLLESQVECDNGHDELQLRLGELT
jgi:hypothetical protein